MGPPLRLDVNPSLFMEVSMNMPRRKVIRLAGYDYSQSGLYFLTSCTRHSLCRLEPFKTERCFPIKLAKWFNAGG
ncbi:hypothetical protein Pan110_04500 [Gimesia panareensis]|nr:hypothetical protein Pan110_04500 [Gimesia panareensis]